MTLEAPTVRAMDHPVREWAKTHKVWAVVLSAVVVFGVVGAVTGNSGDDGKAAVKGGQDPTASTLQEAESAPSAQPATSAPHVPRALRLTPAEQRAQDRAMRRAHRRTALLAWLQSDAPRHVQYLTRGSTSNATITYTATGGGTSQRTVQILPEWRAADAKLRSGAFAYISAQNEQDYGTVSCKIIVLTPYGARTIAPVTTSSGAYAITDCNGTVP